VFEVTYIYDSVLIPVNGIQVVAGDGMWFQGVVQQVGKRFIQGVVDDQPHVAGENPYIPVAQIEDTLYAVVLNIIATVQADVFPLLCKVAFVQ